jgi:hypothetical protein
MAAASDRWSGPPTIGARARNVAEARLLAAASQKSSGQ